jgi:hypothetical protein
MAWINSITSLLEKHSMLIASSKRRRCVRRVAWIGRTAFAALLAAGACSRAEVFLQPSGPTDIGQGLTQYTLRALSTAGEIIHGARDPTIFATGGGMGLHQVWTPITNSPTPTRREQELAGPLWSDSWRPFDSYFFFAEEGSTIPESQFTETKAGTGAVLPSAGFGAPSTGFGSYGFMPPSATRTYSAASGLRGIDVPLAQLVVKANEAVLLSMSVVGDFGMALEEIDGFCVGCEGVPPPEVGNLHLGDVARGSLVAATLPAANPYPFSDLDWSLGSLIGPAGMVAGASVDRDSGLFQWNSPGAPLGSYSAYLIADNTWNADVGVLSFNLVVAEPGAFTLVTFMALAAPSPRRRHGGGGR